METWLYARGLSLTIPISILVERTVPSRLVRWQDSDIATYIYMVTIAISHWGGAHTIVANTSFVIEDDNGKIIIGNDFTMEGGEIAATEGQSITIGQDCMISGDVDIRNGDSHVILDKATGNRTNYAKPIIIGDHVWLTAHVRVLKGSVIPNESIVGNSSVVSGKFDTPNSVLAGNPAKQVKIGITWNRFRNKFKK